MAATIRVTEPALRVEHNYSVTVEFETVHHLKGPSASKNDERAAKVSKSRCDETSERSLPVPRRMPHFICWIVACTPFG